MSPERNEPCPCGSGRKYKKCCLNERTTADPNELLWRRSNAVDEKLATDVLRFARRELGAAIMEQAREAYLGGAAPEGDIVDTEIQSFLPWMLYSWVPPQLAGAQPPAGTLGALYLERRGANLDAFERRYLESCAHEPFSFYEVLATEPGRGFEVEDVLRGDRLRVAERSASRVLRPHHLVWAHVVTVDEDLRVLGGVGSLPLPPMYKVELIDLRRAILGRRRSLGTDDLRVHADALRMLYLRIRSALLHPIPPQMQNTDGEPLAFNRMQMQVEDPEAALAALADLDPWGPPEEGSPELERDASGKLRRAALVWRKHGNQRMPSWDNTILGHMTLEGTTLVVEVNSNQRARRTRAEIEKRLGGGVRFVRGVVTSAAEAMAASQRRGASPPERSELVKDPALQQALREHLEAHYQAWVDEAIPVLGGKTPRQAVKTRDGRAKVEAMLTAIESEGVGGAPGLHVDLGAVRRELGLGLAAKP